MSVRIELRGKRWVADIIVQGPAGRVRVRRNVPMEITSESGARRWADGRARYLALHGKDVPEPEEAPFFADFSGRWLKEYARAEALKPSTIDTYERHIRVHLVPALPGLRLDAIGETEIQQVKLALEKGSKKSRHDILGTLQNILNAAERWGEIGRAPEIDKPRLDEPQMEFYTFEEWEQLVAGAREAGPMPLAALLMGGEGGLRRGELIAFDDVDADDVALNVRRNEWRGIVGSPKGGKGRRVPMTRRLAAAVKGVRHQKRGRLLRTSKGRKLTVATLQSWLQLACRRAGLPETRNVHKLRHTFGAHLAMRGAPAKVIQELMGHTDLKTTMRYMHLAAGSKEAAIALLDRGAGVEQNPPDA